MDDGDEQRLLRTRQTGLADARDRLDIASAGSAPMLVKVVAQAAVPTAVGKYFACRVAEVGGVEGEGNIPTFTATTGDLYVQVVGPRVPVAGDYLLAIPDGGRWTAQTRGQPGPCPDPIPLTLTLFDAYWPLTITITSTDGGVSWWGCGTVSWEGGDFGGFGVCPGSTVALTYRMTFDASGGTPVPILAIFIPLIGGTICLPDSTCGDPIDLGHAYEATGLTGGFDLNRLDWRCVPTFRARFFTEPNVLRLHNPTGNVITIQPPP